MTYNKPVDSDDCLMTVEEFRDSVREYAFTDDDGHGYAVKDGFADWSRRVYPSEINLIPADATHVVWYNK